ncbi:MAG: FAD-dependent oxidoreductase [Polyangiaceae bacterium]
MSVVIVGGGVAGTAAAWRLAARGAQPIVIDARMGASDQTSGAIDDTPWERRLPSQTTQLSAHAQAFVDALGVWSVSQRSAIVATSSGTLRPAAGVDRAVLDLGEDEERPLVVGVAEVPKRGWDGRGLAAELDAEPLAQRRRIHFVPVPLTALLRDDERLYPDVDLAAAHDERERIEWLAARVKEARAQVAFDALLVGPWLGLRESRASELSTLAGVRCGEVLSPPQGAAGFRLRHALDGLQQRLRVKTILGEAKIFRESKQWKVELLSGALAGQSMLTASVVLTVGGVTSGGVSLLRTDPTRIEAPSPRFIFPAYRGAILSHDPPGSAGEWTPSNRDPNLRWSPESPGTIERVGLIHQGGRVLTDSGEPEPSLFAAGDALASRPRTVLEAVRAGLKAAELVPTTGGP